MSTVIENILEDVPVGKVVCVRVKHRGVESMFRSRLAIEDFCKAYRRSPIQIDGNFWVCVTPTAYFDSFTVELQS